jgi:hypothetical protein
MNKNGSSDYGTGIVVNQKVVFSLIGLLFLIALAGCVISPRRTLGESPSPSTTPSPTPTATPILTPTPTPVPAAIGLIYVTSGSQNSVMRFGNAFTTSGNVSPDATISGAATALSTPISLALDSSANRLFVVSRGSASILVFDQISTKTGNAAPDRVITGVATNLFLPIQPFLDKSRDLLYVADDIDVLVFAAASTANGNVAVSRDIQVGFSVGAVVVDTVADRLFLADRTGNTINVYNNASTLNGVATPTRQISGAATGLGTPAGLQIDSSGRLVVSNSSPPSITVYSAAASGNVTPAAIISGSNTGFVSPNQIAFDTTARDTLYVADPGSGAISVFTSFSSANGNLAPTRTITGTATTLTTTGQNSGIALDVSR